MTFYALACSFPPAIAPTCDGAERRITAAAMRSVRAQLGYCMTQLYKETRALLVPHVLSENHKTKRKLQSSCRAQKASNRSPPTCHASCRLSLLPSTYTSPPLPSAPFANKRSDLHPPLYLDVFTVFISTFPPLKHKDGAFLRRQLATRQTKGVNSKLAEKPTPKTLAWSSS